MKPSRFFAIYIMSILVVPFYANAFWNIKMSCVDENESFSLTSILDSGGYLSKLLHQDFQPNHLGQPTVINEFELDVLSLEINDEHLVLTAESFDQELVSYHVQTKFDYAKKETGSLFYSGTLGYVTEDYEGHLNVSCEVTAQ